MDNRQTTVIEPLNYELWEEKFTPVANVHDTNAAFSGIMYETFGDELDMVQWIHDNRPQHVWTLVDTDCGERIVEGMQIVNRIGYFITSEPAAENTQYEVILED